MPEDLRYLDELLQRRPGNDPNLSLHLGLWPEGTPDRDLAAAQGRLDQRVLDASRLEPGQRILDVGCGIGGTLARAAARCGGLDLVGLNLDPQQLAIASRSARVDGSQVRWVQGDAVALPFGDGAFERVLSVEAAFHFRSREAFVSEARRVLRSGGRVVLTDLVGSAAFRARRHEAEARASEDLLRAGLGPWPDLFGPDGGWEALASGLGLALAQHEDLSQAALPSFPCFLGPAFGRPLEALPDPVTRAVAELGRRLADGSLRLVLIALERRP